MASTEPVALVPMAERWFTNTHTTVITMPLFGVVLQDHTGLVALGLMVERWFADPIRPLLSQREGWSACGSAFSP